MKCMRFFGSVVCLLLAGPAWADDDPSLIEQIQIKPYGIIKLEAIYDNSEVAQGDWLLYAYPNNSPRADINVFTMNARHSRLGMKISGPSVERGGKINGLIEVDFAGGFPNSATAARQPQLRLRHAWVELDYPKWAFRFGQDWALIAGPFPSTASFVVGAGKGNLWMRFPQIQVTRKYNRAKFAFSVNRPMAGNVKYDTYTGGDFDPVDDGECTAMPWLMGRGWVNAGPVVFSVSGHYGLEDLKDLSGFEHQKESYSINGDMQGKAGRLQFAARGFYGANLNTFFGGVFQGFRADSVSVTNVRTAGGWANLRYAVNRNWEFTLGGGVDNPRNEDVWPGGKTRNDWIFGNIAYKMGNFITFMLESEYLRTSYSGQSRGDNLRMHFATYLYF